MNMEQKINKITEITKNLLEKMGLQGDVRFEENSLANNKLSVVSIESDQNLSLLIGKNGQNLNAFEYLVRIIAARSLADEKNAGAPNFIVDINDYRKSRTMYLIGLVKETAKRVIQTKRAEALLPMNASERRLVHTELASYGELQTESIGQEPWRRVVVKPQPE